MIGPICNPPVEDHKVLVDGLDTTPDFLIPKLSAGGNIMLTVINVGGNEQLVIAAVVPPGSSDHKVIVDGADTTAAFLAAKLAAGSGISFTILNPGGNEQVQIQVVNIPATAIAAWATVVRANKNMAASVTTVDNDLACATAVATTPANSTALGGYIDVRVNGVDYTVGDASKTTDCYFSGDGGVTARALKSVVAGDLLYWNQSVVGFNLATTDRVDFLYDVAT